MADVWSTITMFNTRSFKILLLRDAICLSLLYNSKKSPLWGIWWTLCQVVSKNQAASLRQKKTGLNPV